MRGLLLVAVLIIGLVGIVKSEDGGVGGGAREEEHQKENSNNDDEGDEDDENDDDEEENDGNNAGELNKQDEKTNQHGGEQHNIQNDAPNSHSSGLKCHKPDMSEANRLCSKNWQKKYYFDPSETKPWERCRFVWYGGCESMSKQAAVFDSEHECYTSCGVNNECQFYHSSKYCLGEYDEHKWTQFYTFDPNQRKCVNSWYGNCSTFNYYTTMEQCQQKCGRQ